MKLDEILKKYPTLINLKGLVPDNLIENDIGSKISFFEKYIEEGKKYIPTVNLNRVFPIELEKGKIVLENFLGHWGNVSVEELCKICLIIQYLKPKRILEIGTYNGMTTLQIALNAPSNCITYTLDLPEDVSASLQLSEIDTYVSKHFKKKFGTGVGSYFRDRNDLNIRQLWGDSANFDYSVIDGEIDIIFIDAAHDYANKKIDSENAFKLLAPNGVILWHNYNDVLCPDVTKYLMEIAKTKSILHLRNTMIAVYVDK